MEEVCRLQYASKCYAFMMGKERRAEHLSYMNGLPPGFLHSGHLPTAHKRTKIPQCKNPMLLVTLIHYELFATMFRQVGQLWHMGIVHSKLKHVLLDLKCARVKIATLL
ncbi:hypothetical protein EJB05_24227 [Eragrostis curvula]|uniref:Uncharacterized protein n=1 Tax=Eragrostis curvula TaxID=38414 RepID=A0A5J9V939_9POAL|nr:hypothetical protein EJB05_24227 [Eragrostis curvula]